MAVGILNLNGTDVVVDAAQVSECDPPCYQMCNDSDDGPTDNQ